MKRLIFLAFGVALLFCVAACRENLAKDDNEALSRQNDILFVKNGIQGELAEVQESGLAITNTNNQKIISLAKMMIDDHSDAVDGLRKLATDKKIGGQDTTISITDQKFITELSGKSGASFDKAYLRTMVESHTQAIQLYTAASNSTDNDIKTFASKTLPVIKKHLDSANSILVTLK